MPAICTFQMRIIFKSFATIWRKDERLTQELRNDLTKKMMVWLNPQVFHNDLTKELKVWLDSILNQVFGYDLTKKWRFHSKSLSVPQQFDVKMKVWLNSQVFHNDLTKKRKVWLNNTLNQVFLYDLTQSSRVPQQFDDKMKVWLNPQVFRNDLTRNWSSMSCS